MLALVLESSGTVEDPLGFGSMEGRGRGKKEEEDATDKTSIDTLFFSSNFFYGSYNTGADKLAENVNKPYKHKALPTTCLRGTGGMEKFLQELRQVPL